MLLLECNWNTNNVIVPLYNSRNHFIIISKIVKVYLVHEKCLR